MASYSVAYGPYQVAFVVTGLTIGSTVRFFVRLASDKSDTTDDHKETAASSTIMYTSYALAPSTSYTVNVHDGSAWIGDQTFTTPPVPGVSVSSVTDTSVTVNFSNLKSGTGYSVTIEPVAAGTGINKTQSAFTATSTSKTETYNGLTPNTEYRISIYVGDTDAGNGSASFTTAAATTWALSSAALGTLSSSYSGSYSFGAYRLLRFSVVFATSGTAKFYTTGSMDTVGYLSTTTGWDTSTGAPTSYLAYNDDDSGTNFGFTFNVAAGTAYYLWVRLYNGANTGSAYICVDPPAVTWSLAAAELLVLSDVHSGEYSFGEYVLRRIAVRFKTSGTAKFYTTGSMDTVGYLSITTNWDMSTGIPASYLVTNDDGGSSYNFSFTYDVAAGTTYYLWVRLYSGTSAGSAYICIEPPSLPRPADWAWYTAVAQGGEIGLSALEWNDFCARINEFRVYTGLAEYSFTTAYSGTTKISAAIVNQARTAINAISGHGTLPAAVSAGDPIAASFFNGLKDALNSIP